jgi:uncharacterized protein with FMN-binding domain
MTKSHYQQTFDPGRPIKKFLLSSFVIFAFIGYVIQQKFSNPDSGLNPLQTLSNVFSQQSGNSPGSSSSSSNSSSNQMVYKDGIYTGPQVNAYYGIVEVQVTVKNGNIADVQFLKYPNDRRTSVRINNIVMPYLQQEAIQAQSAHVNIISGATFTSRGFAMSLNGALQSANN